MLTGTACGKFSESVGILHGAKSYLLNEDDNHYTIGVCRTRLSCAAARYLKDTARVGRGVDDQEALRGFRMLSETEGILPALESSHAVAWAIEEAARRPSTDRILVNLSGRGDKDTHTVAKERGVDLS